MTTPASAPVAEIGYQLATPYPWWQFQDETTPELVWPQSVYVYDQMRRQDSQVGSVLEAVTRPVLRTPWRIDPAGARAEVVELVSDDLGLPIVGQNQKPPPRTRDKFSWTTHLAEALLMLPLGHSFFEQVYRVTEDGSRAHLRKLALRPAKTIEYVNVAEDGGLISIQQYWVKQGEQPRPIPVNRLVAYVYRKEGANWLGLSVLRNCYKNWLLKDRLLRVDAQTIERNGMGVPLYTAQEGATSTDLDKGLALAKSWRSGETAGSAVPSGAKLELIGVSGTLPQALPSIEYHDTQIARAVLAHFLNLDTQTHGSYALGASFMDFFTLSLQTLAQYVADVATAHVVEDLVDINFGEDEPAPRVVFDEIGSRQAATASSIKSLVDAGIIQPDEVLEESSRQQYGLPPKDPSTTRDTSGGGGGGFGTTPPAAFGTGSVANQVYASGDAGPKDVAASSSTDLYDDEFDDEVMEAALAAALFEFAGVVQAAAGLRWNPALHPRDRHGRFRTVFARVMDALAKWSRGEGDEHPLKGQGFTRDNLRDVATKHFGLTVRRGAPAEDIEKQLKDHVRELVRAQKTGEAPRLPGAPKGHQRFTITHNGQSVDVGVFQNSDGSLSLYRESDAGVKQGRAIRRFADAGELESWAREQGHTDLAEHAAGASKAGPAKVAKKATPRKAPPKALDLTGEGGLSSDPAVREVQVENRIRAAYSARPPGQQRFVGLADLRERIGPDVPRAEVDAALRRMADADELNLRPADMGNTFPWAVHTGSWGPLGTRDRQAAIEVGGQPKHMVDFNHPGGRVTVAEANEYRPSLRPLPTPARKVTPRKAVPTPQADKDRLRGVAETLSELDELTANDASARAIQHRMRARGEQHNLSPDLVAKLTDAGESGDRTRVQSVMDRIAKDNGLTRVGRSGETVPFDRRRHSSISPDTGAGQSVHVISPGYEATIDGKTVTLRKAVVQKRGGTASAVTPTKAPSLADAPDLTGLTIRQKRARLKALDYTPEQVDELAPTAAMAKKAAAPKVAKKATPAKKAAPVSAPKIREDVPLIGDPEGDNSIMHGDSVTMELAQAYARKNRNGTANHLMQLRRSTSTMRGEDAKDLDGPQKLVDELKQLRDAEADATLRAKLDKAIKELDFPKTPVPSVPDGTPPAARKLLEDLNKIPVARAPKGSHLHGLTTQQDSPVGRLAAVFRDIEEKKGNVSLGQTESEIEDILRTYHESIDGAYRMWGLSTRAESDNELRPQLREWIRRLRSEGG